MSQKCKQYGRRTGGNGRANNGRNTDQNGRDRNQNNVGSRFVANKVAKFKSTEDDNYCDNLCTLIGPENKPEEGYVLLKVLGLGHQLRGYNKYEYSLPLKQRNIYDLHKTFVESNWTLPAFNMTKGSIQQEFYLRTREAWTAWHQRKMSTRNINNVYVDTAEIGTVPWDRVQPKLSQVLKFFRDVWILKPNLNKKEAHDLARKLLLKHIKTGKDPSKFFKRYITEKREESAYELLDDMAHSLSDDKTHFDDPIKACKTFRVVLGHLGKSTRGRHRDWFDCLLEWYSSMPGKEEEIIERFKWLDNVELQELPEENAKRRKHEKNQAKRAAQTQALAALADADANAAMDIDAPDLTDAAVAASGTATSTTTTIAEAAEAEETAEAAAASTTTTTTTAEAAAASTKTTTTVEAAVVSTTTTTDVLNDTSKTATQAPAPAPASKVPTHRLMANQTEVPIVELSVSDLKENENALDKLHGTYINKICHDGNFINLAPTVERKRSAGGAIKFTKPNALWAKANIWLYVQLQSFNSTMTATYELKTKGMSADTRVKYAIQCSELCGFFREGEVKTKAHVDANISQWLPPLLQHSFVMHMATLFSLYAGINFPPPPKNQALVSNYKKAKSALRHTRFPSYASGVLQHVVDKLVELKV